MSTQIKTAKVFTKDEIAAVAMINEPIKTKIENKMIYPVTVKFITENGEINRVELESTASKIEDLVDKVAEWIDWFNANKIFEHEVRSWSYFEHEVRLWSY